MKSNKYKKVSVYYSGHGRTGSGDWVMKDNKGLSFDKFFAIFEGYVNELTLLIDCCYAGQWCQRADERKMELKKRFVYLKIVAATDENSTIKFE